MDRCSDCGAKHAKDCLGSCIDFSCGACMGEHTKAELEEIHLKRLPQNKKVGRPKKVDGPHFEEVELWDHPDMITDKRNMVWASRKDIKRKHRKKVVDNAPWGAVVSPKEEEA